MRRTRILATIGPASNSPETILELLEAGVDAFRLNFSHGVREDHAAMCKRIREVAAAAGRDVTIVQDLGGPKIRTGKVADGTRLEDESQLVIERGDFVGDASRVSCSFDALYTSVSTGDRLLIDDGRIELEVQTVAPEHLRTRVVIGGALHSSKGINVPTSSLKTSALTPKDREDMAAGIAMGVDMVAVSFVQSPQDMIDAREVATSCGAPYLPLIAKIEKLLNHD